MNKVQELINELVEKYSIRSFVAGDDQWFAINDLSIAERTLKRYLKDIEETDLEFYNTNIKKFNMNNINHVKNDIVEKQGVFYVYKNFYDKPLSNNGEMFAKFKLFNLIVNMSNLGLKYKIGITHIVEEIRQNDFYIDESISGDNLDKLQNEVDRLRGLIVAGNGGFEGTQYKVLTMVAKEWSKAKGIDITREMLLELMRKAKYIKKDGSLTYAAEYANKIILKNDIYFLSPRGHDLLLKQLNKYNDEELREWSRKRKAEGVPF